MIHSAPAAGRCALCRFCQRDQAAIERLIPGLAVMGSAYGASIAGSRLCLRHDQLVGPGDCCPAFAPGKQATASLP